MNRYEGIYILKENLTKEERNKTIEDLKKCIDTVDSIKNMGVKKLAYEINGNINGDYIQIMYKSKNCKDIELQARVDDNVLKFINLKLNYDEYENLLDDKESEIIANLEFGHELRNILNKYTENNWETDPLDVDEVDYLVDILRDELNLLNGNMTAKEYYLRAEYSEGKWR